VSAARHAPLADELAALPLFSDLTPDQLRHLAHVAARVQEPKGEVLTKEGERGHELMIVLDGTVEVRHDGRVLATLGPGDVLGEVALFEPEARRTATSVATTRVTVAFVARHDLDHLMAEAPELADRLAATARERHEHIGEV
jgi:CRP/FNR family cyclic AMP-dependent transcriptional regulator